MTSDFPWPYDSSRQAPRPRRPEAAPFWAAHPKKLFRRGQPVDGYYIGALAAALDKSTFTIRRWEREGIIPPTPLIFPVRGGAPRRIYLRDQIEGIVRIAEQEGILQRKPPDIDATNFTDRVHRLYSQVFPEHSDLDA